MARAVPSEFCFYLLSSAGVKPWALGVFVVLIGLGGLAFLACSDWDKYGSPELAEGAFVLCALMVVTPPLLLLPEVLRLEIPAYVLVIAALAVYAGLSLLLGLCLGRVRLGWIAGTSGLAVMGILAIVYACC